MPVVLKDILESSVVGIGSGTDYIPETLIHENGRVGNFNQQSQRFFLFTVLKRSYLT